jgi:hypothetical protein
VGIDIDYFRECVQRHCKPKSEKVAITLSPKAEEIKIHDMPEMRSALKIMAKQRISSQNIGFEEPARTIPIKKLDRKIVHEGDEIIPEYPYIRPELRKLPKKKFKNKKGRK